jgi:membrane associated rhomboid family serine protease
VFYLFTFYEDVARIKFQNDIYLNVAIPSTFGEFIKKPWTLFTHMFYHAEVWHVVGNMLWLWMFGYIFQDMTGNRKIIPVYIFGALGGALAFLLAYSFIPSLKGTAIAACGASAGIMAIVIATTMVAPDFRIFPMINGGIPLWVLTIVFLIIDLGLMADGNTGGHIAHLAGALTGYLFMVSMRRGNDWSEWLNGIGDWFANLFNPEKDKKKIKEQLFYRSGRVPYSRSPNLTQQRIDEILDKINQNGYESLTTEEKELLKRASKEDI